MTTIRIDFSRSKGKSPCGQTGTGCRDTMGTDCGKAPDKCTRTSTEDGVLISDMTSTLVMQYECYLKSKGVTRNTSSFYMRILRAAYNRV